MEFVQFTKLFNREDQDGDRVYEFEFYNLNDEDDEWEYCIDPDNDDYEFLSTVSFWDEEQDNVRHVKKDDSYWSVFKIEIIEEA